MFTWEWDNCIGWAMRHVPRACQPGKWLLGFFARDGHGGFRANAVVDDFGDLVVVPQ